MSHLLSQTHLCSDSVLTATGCARDMTLYQAAGMHGPGYYCTRFTGPVENYWGLLHNKAYRLKGQVIVTKMKLQLVCCLACASVSVVL